MKPTRTSIDSPHGATTHPIFDRMRAEHAWVLQTLDALDRELAGRRGQAQARPSFPVAAVRPLAESLAREFAAHASAEDDVLGPLLAGGLPDGPSQVRQLVAEHAELRAMLAAFLVTLDAPASSRRDEQLTVQAHDFTALIRSQIRKEETLVFGIAEKQIARGAVSRPKPSKGEPR
jgi:hemerythrin-like domain-containing protein